MGTHATLGVKFPDGSISGCYVHYDGGTMLPRLHDYLEKNTTTGLVVLITEAQATGGIRSFHCPLFDSTYGEDLDLSHATTELLDDNEPYIIDENNWDYDHLGAGYHYLVNYETGTIHTEAGAKR